MLSIKSQGNGDDAADERVKWLAEHYIEPTIKRAFADGEARWLLTFKKLLESDGSLPKRVRRLEIANEWLIVRILVLSAIVATSFTWLMNL